MDKGIYFVSGYIRFTRKYENFNKLIKLEKLKKKENIQSFKLSNYELKFSLKRDRN